MISVKYIYANIFCTYIEKKINYITVHQLYFTHILDKYGQLSKTFRFDILIIYRCRRIRLEIVSYEIHLLVTKTKSDNSFCA